MENNENKTGEHSGFKKVKLIAAASAALLLGHDRIPNYTYNSDTADSSHVQMLSDEQQTQLADNSSLKFKAIIPGVASGENTIQSGANTHLSVNTEPFGYADLETFEKQVDLLKQYHQTEIRFGIPRWDAAKLSEDKKTIIWNEEEIGYFKQAVKYAQEKGLNVYFVTTPPEVPEGFNFNKYLDITRQYYEKIGEEFRGVIHQPGNEFDVHDINDYHVYEKEISDQDLEKYKIWLDTATRAIRKSDPLVQITQSLSGYPMDEDTIIRWKRINAAIGKFIDFYSLDTYPRNAEEAGNLPLLVSKFGSETGKEFVITELGLPTIGGYSEQMQGDVVSAAVDAYKKAGIKTLIYELKDEKFDDVEGHFGLLDQKGNPKYSFFQVMSALQKEGNFK